MEFCHSVNVSVQRGFVFHVQNIVYDASNTRIFDIDIRMRLRQFFLRHHYASLRSTRTFEDTIYGDQQETLRRKVS